MDVESTDTTQQNEDVKRSMREHIKSLPRIEDRYVRSDNSKEFVSISAGKPVIYP